MATSPILYRDTVILVQDGDDGRSRLLALRKDTGEKAWEQPPVIQSWVVHAHGLPP